MDDNPGQLVVLNERDDILVRDIKELHANLVRRYKTHRKAIEKRWRGFDRNQRARICRDLFPKYDLTTTPNHTLVHNIVSDDFSVDPSIADDTASILSQETHPYRICTKPEYLLNLLEKRATKSLMQLFGVNEQGKDVDKDGDLITVLALAGNGKNLEEYTGREFVIFLTDELYGLFVTESSPPDLHRIAKLLKSSPYLVPFEVGMLVLQRQLHLAHNLGQLMIDILEEDSQTRATFDMKAARANMAAAFKQSDDVPARPQKKETIAELSVMAREYADIFRDLLPFMVKEPVFLALATRANQCSHPGNVPDEEGECANLISDQYNGIAFVEHCHDTLAGVAIWDYLGHLLEKATTQLADKAYRSNLLQEISNVCSLAFEIAQEQFKRRFQVGAGKNFFMRVGTNPTKLIEHSVVMKIKPEELTRTDPQMHYLLQLCSPHTNAKRAQALSRQVGGLLRDHPAERGMMRGEAEAYFFLAVVAGMVNDFARVLPLPAPSRKKGRLFTGRMDHLSQEMCQLKMEIDLLDFVAPIDHLLEPGMAVAAMKALDTFMTEKAGAKMEHLYQDMVTDALNDLDRQCQDIKAKLKTNGKSPHTSPFQEWTPQPLQERVEQRKLKEKTRPSQSSIYDYIEPVEHAADSGHDEHTESVEKPHFTVTPSTKVVFATLLDKSMDARGSVTWTAFKAAMAELGFSVIPKMGSVYAFNPPEGMKCKKSLTIHRPHQSKIEGTLLCYYASRLKQVFGWDEETFAVA